MNKHLALALSTALLATPLLALADLTVTMNRVDEKGVQGAVGTVSISESAYGVVFTPAITGLPAGSHGFHLHENPSCGPKEKDGKMTAALAAGGHYDPTGSKHHGLPWGDGHLGDLPPLVVDANGLAASPVLASRLKMDDVHGRALMVHAGGDNHSDHPAALGGGGPRMVCGVIP